LIEEIAVVLMRSDQTLIRAWMISTDERTINLSSTAFD
jgi:hypothetical protein